MSEEEIYDKIKNIIIDRLGTSESAINLNSSFVDDLGADSLDMVELISTVEDEFDIEVPETDAEQVSTVEDVVNYIKENVK